MRSDSSSPSSESESEVGEYLDEVEVEEGTAVRIVEGVTGCEWLMVAAQGASIETRCCWMVHGVLERNGLLIV